MTDLKNFAALLVRARSDAGMTQEQFAAVLGVAKSRVGAYETGTRGQSIVSAARILLALREYGVELDEVAQ